MTSQTQSEMVKKVDSRDGALLKDVQQRSEGRPLVISDSSLVVSSLPVETASITGSRKKRRGRKTKKRNY